MILVGQQAATAPEEEVEEVAGARKRAVEVEAAVWELVSLVMVDNVCVVNFQVYQRAATAIK